MKNLTHRLTRSAIAAAGCVLATTAVVACGSSAASTGSSSGVLTVVGFGNNPTFVDNYNLASPNLASLANMMYEPLVYLDDNHMTVRPYLARSWDWSTDAKTLTMHLRHGVTWSDGKPFTSADVKYTYVTLPKQYPKLPITVPPFQSLDVPDRYTVVFHFAAPSRTTFGPYSWTGGFIVPQHIWATKDISKWTNPKPVTTGPFVVQNFTPQQITLKVRNDWWGGKSKGVKTVRILAEGSPQAAEAAMLKGAADWANIGWQGYEKQWLKADPAHHKYWQATNAYFEVTFNLAKAPFTDVNVRRALRDAVNTAELIKVEDTGMKVPNVSTMDPAVFGDQVAPELRDKFQKQDVTKAKAELAAGGYSIVGGTLTKNGRRFPLTLQTNQGDATGARVVADQWKRALGLHVTVQQVSDNAYSENLGKGAFDMIMWNGGGCSAYCNFNYLDSTNSAPLGKVAAADMSRAHDPALDRMLHQLGAATTAQQIQQLGWDIQRRFVSQAYYICLDASGATAVVNNRNWQFPAPLQGKAFPGLGLYTEPAIVIMNLKPAR